VLLEFILVLLFVVYNLLYAVMQFIVTFLLIIYHAIFILYNSHLEIYIYNIFLSNCSALESFVDVGRKSEIHDIAFT
jgi:hypothetical protein